MVLSTARTRAVEGRAGDVPILMLRAVAIRIRHHERMRGDEARVVAAFRQWLESDGWATELEVEFVDILATRGDERMYVEAKGRTSSPGLDIDTLYGQLLRRMPEQEVATAIFAVVVPTSALKAANRVPERVRTLLGIRVYGVTDDGSVIAPPK